MRNAWLAADVRPQMRWLAQRRELADVAADYFMQHLLYIFDVYCIAAFRSLVMAWSGDVAALAVSCAGARVRIAARAPDSASCLCPYPYFHGIAQARASGKSSSQS